MGLAWAREEHPGGPVISKYGLVGGFASELIVDRGSGRVAAVATNTRSESPNDLAEMLIPLEYVPG